MRRELSSRITPLYRWVIPAMLSIAAFVVVWRLARIGMPGRPDPEALLLAITIAAALVCLARLLDRAKRVWIEGDTLIVSDYRREARVDLGAISSVTATRFVKPDRVRVRFSRATKFGDSIVFFPPSDWSRFSVPHPVAAELGRRAAEAGHAGRRAGTDEMGAGRRPHCQ